MKYQFSDRFASYLLLRSRTAHRLLIETIGRPIGQWSVRLSDHDGPQRRQDVPRSAPYLKGESAMPMYDYTCMDCGKESLVVLTLKEHESSKVTCPNCGSIKMRQLYTSFVAHTTKKS